MGRGTMTQPEVMQQPEKGKPPAATEFEFLRSLPFGPYLATGSPVHRLDPRTRILLVVGFMAALILAKDPIGLVIGLVAAVAAWGLSRIPYEPLRRSWFAALPFILFLAIIQIVFRMRGPTEQIIFQFKWLSISLLDLWYGLALLLRFSGFMTVLGLAAASLSESELTHGMESLLEPLNRIHIPTSDFIMVIQVTLRYFPLLAQTAERIAKAQASRGADWHPAGWNFIRRIRQVVPIMVPLFISSLRRAENMALAMDVRGYGSRPARTSMVVLRYTRRDLVAFLLGFLVILLVVLL
jgi:energy-coupling factor transport system permease protein